MGQTPFLMPGVGMWQEQAEPDVNSERMFDGKKFYSTSCSVQTVAEIQTDKGEEKDSDEMKRLPAIAMVIPITEINVR